MVTNVNTVEKRSSRDFSFNPIDVESDDAAVVVESLHDVWG